MQAKVDTRDFISAIKNVIWATNGKQVVGDQLKNAMKLSVSSNNSLTLTSFNFTVSIESVLDAEDCVDGEFCVNSKSLFDIVSKCASDYIFIFFENSTCTIKSGKAKFGLPAIGAEEFPQLPKTGEIKPINIDAIKLVESANKVLYAAAQDDKKPELHGVSVEIENGAINLVACDGFRLSNIKIDADSDKELKIIVPSETVSILSKIVKENNCDAQLFASNRFLMIKFENTILTSRLISGIYMDWRKAIPQQNSIDCVFEKNKIVKAIEMAQTVQSTTGKITGCLVFQIDKNVAKVSLKSQAGQFEDEIEFETNGALKMSIAFNPKYLLDAIRTVDSNEIDLMIIGSLSPCFVKNKEDDSVINMVLPVRIKE